MRVRLETAPTTFLILNSIRRVAFVFSERNNLFLRKKIFYFRKLRRLSPKVTILNPKVTKVISESYDSISGNYFFTYK